ncbi:MAG: DNA polymerase I [Clostridiales bacterium 38-18]|nr:MAG: DNA polymerase I [Clostridiales bacterium 38-18]
MEQKMIIIDGNSLINRAYFAMSEMKNSNGVYTGGIYGLTNMIYSLIEQFKPSHFCVAFDMKGPTFRHQSYDQYKGTRKGMPDELAMQMPIVKEILDAMNIMRLELQGYEADDLIGTVARACMDQNIVPHVITGDKDALQLVAFGANVHITKKGITQLKRYSDEDIMEEWGVHANQVIDFKGISGDSSDNIPGIPGFGPKTASKLLEQFGTVENMVANYDQIENKRWKGLVEEYAEQAVMCKRLATIMTEVPIEIDFDMFLLEEPSLDSLIGLFKKYELNSLLSRIKVEAVSVETTLSQDQVSLNTFIDLALSRKQFSFLTYCDVDEIVVRKFRKAIFKVDEAICILDDIEDLKLLKPLFENKSILKSGYDLKKEYLLLMQEGIDLNGVSFDGFIAAYLVEPARKNYDLAEVTFENVSYKMVSEEDLLGKGAKKIAYGQVNNEEMNRFVLSQIEGATRLQAYFETKLESMSLVSLFKEVEVPLVKILSDIEFTGFRVDKVQIDQLDEQLITKIAEIEVSVYEMAGESFNINSPKQLGTILFEKLGLPSEKKTKTGYSTSHDVLEKLSNQHPIVNEIIEYRTYTKLKSTYIDGLRLVITDGDRVHTSLNQTIAVTGRLSSTDPNLQNIPIKLPFGRKIRRFFIANQDSVLLDADYSQIELRVLAHLSEDPKLIEAFKTDMDIHTLTASQVFHVAEAEVSSLQRSRAKEVNFGIVYGMGDFGLSESLGISRKDAKTYIENYFDSYPRVKDFMDEIINACKDNGYVETILGRRREIVDINNSNFMLRSAAERIARNTPIQGSAADIIKLAMIKVFDALKASKLKSKLILQVHDELILNVPLDEIEPVKALLKSCMEEAYQLIVPLKVEMNTGDSWYDAH